MATKRVRAPKWRTRRLLEQVSGSPFPSSTAPPPTQQFPGGFGYDWAVTQDDRKGSYTWRTSPLDEQSWSPQMSPEEFLKRHPSFTVGPADGTHNPAQMAQIYADIEERLRTMEGMHIKNASGLVDQWARATSNALIRFQQETMPRTAFGFDASQMTTEQRIAFAGYQQLGDQLRQITDLYGNQARQMSEYQAFTAWDFGLGMVNLETWGFLPGLGLNIMGVDAATIGFLSNYQAGLVTDLWDGQRRELSRIIQWGSLGMYSFAEMQQGIMGLGLGKSVFKSLLTRAETIARTETSRVWNTSYRVNSQKIRDLPGMDGIKKTWMHRTGMMLPGPKVKGMYQPRRDHVALDGVTIPWEEMFSVGGYQAEGPHDPHLPASQTINCGCRLVNNFDDTDIMKGLDAPAVDSVELANLQEMLKGDFAGNAIEALLKGRDGFDDGRQSGNLEKAAASMWHVNKAMKDEVVRRLEEALRGKHDFGDFALWFQSQKDLTSNWVTRYQGDNVLNTIDMLISQWAKTSADESPLSLVLQEAVQNVFDLKEVYDRSAQFQELAVGTEAWQRYQEYQEWMPQLEAFIEAQYTLTQARLSEIGYEGYTLFRGTGEESGAAFGSEGQMIEFLLQPASSFSASPQVAKEFGKRMMMIQVPADQILSTPVTGWGAAHELEFVILGGAKTMYVWEADFRDKVGKTSEEIIEYILSWVDVEKWAEYWN